MAVRKLSCWAALILLSGVHCTSVQITTTTRQTIHGVGASGAWWVNDLALYPDDVRQNVSNLLLDQTNGELAACLELARISSYLCRVYVGLGLTDYRYNLGGGGVGVTTWDRAPETPYVRSGTHRYLGTRGSLTCSDGVYNWSADAAGAYYLKEAARQGVPVLTLFVNSAVSADNPLQPPIPLKVHAAAHDNDQQQSELRRHSHHRPHSGIRPVSD